MNSSPAKKQPDAALPPQWPWLVRWFFRYVVRYVRRKAHAVRVLKGAGPGELAHETPVIVAMNHPSWWDPLIAVVTADHYFSSRAHYGPIDAGMLGRYGVLDKLGFFGIEPGDTRGGVRFLRAGEAILSRPGTGLWVTVQGRFTDARVRPIGVQPGTARLAARLPGVIVLPLAVELVYWDQSTPEVLLAFGEPVTVNEDRADADAWHARIEQGLTDAMDRLADAAIARDPARFDTILGGSVGVGGPYDWARRLKALLHGERFDPSHPPTPKP